MGTAIMKTYKDTGIKDIITKFPKIGEILEEYDINCGPCTVGICALKDILDIHALPPDKEQELMARIEAVIYPERKITLPPTNPDEKKPIPPHEFSMTMQHLVDEHMVIKRWLALIPSVVDKMDLSTDRGRQIINDGLDLIRSFADRLHHAKEEDILFTYFDDTEKIFQVIYDDHRIARNYVEEMLTAFENDDVANLSQNLLAYGKLLAEHIHKEDEILFPWLDRNLTNGQLAEIAEKFAAENKRIGIDQEKYQLFLQNLEDFINR